MKKKHITPPENCTGCALCDNVCSQNAIRMVWSKEGFLVPEVNIESCINCGLCVKQCIALEDKTVYTDDLSSVVAYGGWNKDSNIHLTSSSGGIFTAIAEHVIGQGGVVFGVVWLDKLTAVFSKTETVEGLAHMRGSKYTPAVPGKIYLEVRNELKTGRKVLFCGTPCQVHALKKYLRKSYENLLSIDIVCHGAPSHLILEKYIAEDEARTGKTIDHVSFRDKPAGWLGFHVTRYYTDGSKDSVRFSKDAYMKLFLCDKLLNAVCYNCPYAHIPRQGDISLGDYWTVQKHHKDWPIDKGVSAILQNTDKGSQILMEISSKIDMLSEPFSKIYAGQAVVYVKPQKKIPEERTVVLEKLTHLSLVQILEEHVDSVKIGSFYLRKESILYKIIILPRRVFSFAYRKINQLFNH